jgi:hypothetical protein
MKAQLLKNGLYLSLLYQQSHGRTVFEIVKIGYSSSFSLEYVYIYIFNLQTRVSLYYSSSVQL